MRNYAFYLAEQDGKLEQVKSRAIDELIRERYSVSDEFALHRQRYRKPEEFAEYDAFVEQVKAEVNAEIERQRNSRR